MARALLLASVVIGAAMLPLAAASAADVVRPFAQPFDWTGFYLGLHAGEIHGDVTVHESGLIGGNISGPVWGLLAGYNFARSPIAGTVFGVEADVGKVSANGTGGLVEICDVSSDYLYDLTWDAHFRARLGFPQGNFMPFIAGGLALANLDITEECGGEKGGLFTGGTVGAGIDFMIAPQAFLRGEVLYDFYGNKKYEDFSADFNAWTARVALAFRLP